ncbi:unnamed protein product, partial [Brassica rapa]
WLFFSTIHLFAVGTHPAPSEGESTVLRARQLPFDPRQVNFLVSEIVLQRSSLCKNMSGNVADDPFVAYQGAAKVMSAKKRSSSRTISGDEVMITGSRRATVVYTPFLKRARVDRLNGEKAFGGKKPWRLAILGEENRIFKKISKHCFF